MKTLPNLVDRLDHAVFGALYANSLVYNTCWEDPAVDRRALQLTPADTLLAITSAGCNVLDYALAGAGRIDAVDANPRQTALLELKLAGIRGFEYEDFFSLFGRGFHPRAERLYRVVLRRQLSEFARAFWDRRIGWFASPVGSFYYHGLAGLVARGFRGYLRLRPTLAGAVHALLESHDPEEQRSLYDERIRPLMWSKAMNWTLSRQLTLSLLGVPYPQRREVQAQHDNGVAGFIREAIEYVFCELPARTNYFWRVYVRGHYTAECCPEYLKPENFLALAGGRADVIHPRTCTITEFLRDNDRPVSKFVLLDHMDWMASYYPEALIEEWRWILARATPGARLIFRSAHRRPRYLEALRVGDARRNLRELLEFRDALATALHPLDRVHTYAGFHIADVPAA
ncbi:MAG TPA: BtaA family protein [Rhodocyclaceae bacterium]|nr:BtaA family protein [Rhodocyclaceae bacterium]